MTSLNPKLIAATITIAMTAPIAGAHAATTHSLHQARPIATASSQRHAGHFSRSVTSHSSGTSTTFHRYGRNWY